MFVLFPMNRGDPGRRSRALFPCTMTSMEGHPLQTIKPGEEREKEEDEEEEEVEVVVVVVEKEEQLSHEVSI